MSEICNPTWQDPAGVIRKRLDGAQYRLAYRWNTRGEYWAISLYDNDDTALVEGLRINLSRNMLRQFAGLAGFPPGALVAVDTSGTGVEPGRYDLANGRVQIVYLTAEEIG